MQTAKRPKPHLLWLRYQYLIQYYLLTEEKQEELTKLLNEPELGELNLLGIHAWQERMKNVFDIKTEENMNACFPLQPRRFVGMKRRFISW